MCQASTIWDHFFASVSGAPILISVLVLKVKNLLIVHDKCLQFSSQANAHEEMVCSDTVLPSRVAPWHVATEHLGCGWSELRCTATVTDTLWF